MIDRDLARASIEGRRSLTPGVEEAYHQLFWDNEEESTEQNYPGIILIIDVYISRQYPVSRIHPIRLFFAPLIELVEHKRSEHYVKLFFP